MDGTHFTRLQEFLAQVGAIGSPAALAAATSAVSAPFGLPTLMCGALKIAGERVDGHFYFGNWSAAWEETYNASVFARDPIVLEARRRLAPFTWDELVEGDNPAHPWRELFARAEAFGGWTGGYVVPIHGPGAYVALVSFAGRPGHLTLSDRAILLALAHAAFARGRQIYRPESGPAKPRLSSRERQVMRWIANGKTDAEIAQILSISPSTVHSYAEQAKQKLGARSRSQAVNEMALYEML